MRNPFPRTSTTGLNIVMLACCSLLLTTACDGSGFNFGDTDKSDTADAGSTDTNGNDRDARADETSGVVLPGPATDSCVMDDKGGVCKLLGGEVVLTVVEGALGGPQTLTIERRIMSPSGVDLVGYVWGPHGHPVDPAAKVVVTIPPSYVRGDQLALANWSAPDVPKPLPGQSLNVVAEGFELKGELAVLETLVILEQ